MLCFNQTFGFPLSAPESLPWHRLPPAIRRPEPQCGPTPPHGGWPVMPEWRAGRGGGKDVLCMGTFQWEAAWQWGRWPLPQPQLRPSPTSQPGPTDPALWANPYPEVTDLTCQFLLPTLFQHARGCSPWRPSADMGMALHEIYTLSPRFSRAHWMPPEPHLFPGHGAPISGWTHSRVPCPSQSKENSSWGPRHHPQVHLRYRTGRLQRFHVLTKNTLT